ncbi:MAG: hypothetical protein AB8B80_07150, partial [Marinicellaceae bacterium]
GDLKTCITDAGYPETTLLRIFTKLDCRSRGLDNTDVVQIEDLFNLRSLILDDNNAITDISPLNTLSYLTLLSLEYNVNINMDFSDIDEIEDLYLGHMNLSNLPDLSNMVDLEFLDLTSNNIKDGFTNLPESLSVLVLDDNKVKSCLGLDGLAIESISLSGRKVNSFENCSLVEGLKNLTIVDTPNITGNHNINSFAGFCSLELINTNISELKGRRPINSLTLSDNPILEKFNVIRPGLTNTNSNFPNLVPSYVILKGSSNMYCKKLYDVEEFWLNNDKLDMTVSFSTTVNSVEEPSPVCPTINHEFLFNREASCKAEKILNLNAVRVNKQNKFALTWDQTDHALWGITSYEIRENYVAGGVEKIRKLPFDFDFPVYLVNEAINPSFEVRACKTNDADSDNITTLCSDWSDSSWSPGLSKLNSLSASWFDQANDLFNLQFTYPEENIGYESNKPDYFEVYSGLDVSNDVIQTVVFQKNVYEYGSQVLDLNNYLSQEFRVRACKNAHGQYPSTCGLSRLVNVVSQPITDTNNHHLIPDVPTLTSESNNLTQGLIKFAVASSSYVEYFDITETQPVPVVDAAPIFNPDNKKIYTIDAKNNQAALNLIRKVNGNHSFAISACVTETNAEDKIIRYCSEPLNLNWDVLRIVSNPALYNHNIIDESMINVDFDWIDCSENFYDSNIVNSNTNGSGYTGYGCIPTTIGNENEIIGVNNYVRTTLKWEYKNHGGANGTVIDITPPDYFHVSKVIQSGNGINLKAIDNNTNQNSENYQSIIEMCISSQSPIYDVNNASSIQKKYAKQQFIVSNDQQPVNEYIAHKFNTQNACLGGIRVSDDGLWNIKACYSGIGCTKGKEIDILANIQDPNNYDRQGDLSNIRSNENTFFVETERASSDNLQSGLWWNPYQAGTGWYFHWKNNSPNPNKQLKNRQNLLAHWMIYKKYNKDTWSPFWVYADMALTQENDSNDKLYAGQIMYSRILNGVKNEQSLGIIKVLITPDQESHRAKVELDLNYGQDLITQDSIFFEFIGEDDYFTIDHGATGDQLDTITIPLEIASIRLAGELSLDENGNPISGPGVDATRFGQKNDNDHYSGLYVYNDQDDSRDAKIAVWQKHNLEIMNFFIYDDAGEPFWLMSQTCGDPCSVPVTGYFDEYINGTTGENEFGF